MTGNELRQWRDDARLTQAAAGRIVGFGERRVRDFEAGRRPIPASVAAAVEKAQASATGAHCRGECHRSNLMDLKPIPARPAVNLDETFRARDLRDWAWAIPRGLDALTAGVMGTSLRAWQFYRYQSEPGSLVPARLAARLRELAPSGPYRGGDLVAWREAHGLTPQDAAAVLGVPLDRLIAAERQTGRELSLDIAGSLAASEVG